MRSIIAGFALWREAVNTRYANDAIEDGFVVESRRWTARARFWRRGGLWWSGLPADEDATTQARWPS